MFRDRENTPNKAHVQIEKHENARTNNAKALESTIIADNKKAGRCRLFQNNPVYTGLRALR